MGAQPDDIQREIEEQRERLAPRLRVLRGRLGEDVKGAREVAQRRVSQARNVADKGLAILGGSFLLGLMIGMVIQGRRKDRQRDRLLQESVRNWPWRAPYTGRPAWPGH